MGRKRNDELPIGTLDFETDPFRYGRIPYPFASCIYFDKDDYVMFWEPKIVEKTVKALRKLPRCILYAHNGGKFDFHYLIEYANKGEVLVRNTRVVQMNIGKVTLKDSWPLLPFALEEYKKTKIDYATFEAHRRNAAVNRPKIEAYLLDDCRDLRDLVLGFRDIVGPRDTIGAAAFYQMRKLGIKIESMNEAHDDMFRPYYFGGRVEAFTPGYFTKPHYYYDMNSAYPRAMMEEHAHGFLYERKTKLPKKNLGRCLVSFNAESFGALPVRDEDDGTLNFPHTRGHFYATGWEVEAGLDTKTLKIEKIHDVWIPHHTITFRDFVESFYAKRVAAKKAMDKIRYLAYKYLLNSGYGKFAQNPREFKRYLLAKFGKRVPGYEWETDFGAVSLWSKPNFIGWGFYDVATAASICGYQRAALWRGICKSGEVRYCDTDAIITPRRSTVRVSDKLGDWKLEGVAVRLALAGKKLYGIEWAEYDTPEERFKVASKGARLTFAQLVSLCRGNSVEWRNDAPTFSLGNPHFIHRSISATDRKGL